MDKMRVLKHYAFQEVTADLLNSIGTSLFQMSDGMAQAFIAGFQNSDHLIFQDLDVTPDTGLTVNLGLQGVFLYRIDQQNCLVGVYKGTRVDKNSPWTQEQLTFDAADPVNPRIDIIEAEIIEEDDPDYFDTVQIFNNVTETSFAQNKYVRRVRNVKLYKKTGIPAVNPVAPLVTAGRMALREIHIGANASTISPTDIKAQPFDYTLSEWTAPNPTKAFPSIHDLLQYINEELAKTRRTIFRKAGVYTYHVPRFRETLYVRAASGGGGGAAAGILGSSALSGGNGGDTILSDSSGELTRIIGGRGGRVGLGGVSQWLYSDFLGANRLAWSGDGENADGQNGGAGGGIYGRSAVDLDKFSVNNGWCLGFDDDGTTYWRITLSQNPNGPNTPVTGSETRVMSFDSKNRIKTVAAGNITLPNPPNSVISAGTPLYISNELMVYSASNNKSLWKISNSGAITHLAGDIDDADGAIVDGALGINRVNFVISVRKDLKNPGRLVFLDRELLSNKLYIRNVDPSGNVTTECEIIGAGTMNVAMLSCDPLDFDYVIVKMNDPSNIQLSRVNRITGVVSVISQSSINHSEPNGSGHDGPVATAKIGLINDFGFYHSPTDRYFFADVYDVIGVPNTTVARIRYISGYSNLATALLNTLYHAPFGQRYGMGNPALDKVNDRVIIMQNELLNPPNRGYADIVFAPPNVGFTSGTIHLSTDRNTLSDRLNESAYGVNGGGGAGGSTSVLSESGGGGGGSLVVEGAIPVVPGSVITIEVGAGGTRGVNGFDETKAGYAGGDGFVEVSW